jgi:hypothetical protein
MRLNQLNSLTINYDAATVKFNMGPSLDGSYMHTSDKRNFSKMTFSYPPNGWALELNLAREYDGFSLSRGYSQITNNYPFFLYSSYSVQTPQYDANNRLTNIQRETKSFVNGQLVSSVDFNNQYFYAPGSNNNMSQFTQTVPGSSQPAKRTIASFSNDDRLLNLRGSMQRDYTYDADGNVASMTNCDGTTTYEYDVWRSS